MHMRYLQVVGSDCCPTVSGQSEAVEGTLENSCIPPLTSKSKVYKSWRQNVLLMLVMSA